MPVRLHPTAFIALGLPILTSWRSVHSLVPHRERTTSSSRIPSNLSPQSATSMIGPSTSYVPPGYNDLQAIIYSRERPPANDSNSAYYTAQGSFNAAPYNGHSYEAYNSVPQPPSYSYNRSPQSASPRTGYEGWRDATDSSVPPLPASQNSNFGNANAYHQSVGESCFAVNELVLAVALDARDDAYCCSNWVARLPTPLQPAVRFQRTDSASERFAPAAFAEPIFLLRPSSVLNSS